MQTHRFQGTEGQGLLVTQGQLFNGHAPLKIERFFEAFQRHFIGSPQLMDKISVLRLVHGAIQVIGGSLVIPGGKKRFLIIDRSGVDNWREGVVKIKISLA